MTYYIKILLGLLVSFYSLHTFGQPKSHIVHYGLSDGLPQKTVMSILQDKKGFMWFATWGGLCKFDGYNFTTYKTTSDDIGLVNNNRIDKIKEDAFGNIWTYTAYTKEAYRFDPRKEKYITSFYVDKESFKATDILTMPSGKVWLISNTMGAICIPDTTNNYHVFTKANYKLKSNNVLSVFEDSQLTSWILTDNGIIRVKDVDGDEKVDIYLSSDNKVTNSFYASYETDAEVWFGANKGRIISFNKSSGHFNTFDTGINSDIISIQNIYDNLLIILTSKDGFFICNKDKSNFNKFDRNRLKELSTNEIKSCFIDSNNNIWLELGDFKIAKFNLINNSLKCYQSGVSTKGDLLYSPKFSIIEDQNGRIWIHPKGGGFSYYDKLTDTLLPFFNDPLSLNWKFSHILHDLYMDKQGNLWISTRSEGIEKIIFDDETFQKSSFTGKTSALNFEIRAFFEDSNKNIWLGSKEGYIAIYDSKKNFKGYLSVNGTISQSAPPLKLMAYTIFQDKKNNIWIGSKGNGLYLLTSNAQDSYSIKRYKHNRSDIYSLSNDAIYSVHEDNSGNIWVGTIGGGLNLFDQANDRFLNYYNELSTYPMNIGAEIRSINSRNNVIYLATTLGLVTFNYSKENNKPNSYKVYSKSKNGLKADDIYSVYKTKNNDMYLATQGGGLSFIEEFDSLDFPLKFKTFDTTNNKLSSDCILSVIEDDNNILWIISEGNIFAYDRKAGNIKQYNNIFRILENNYFSEAIPLLTSNGELLLGCTQGTLSFIPSDIKVDTYKPYISFSQFKVSGKDYISKGELEYTDNIKLSHSDNHFTIEYAALDFANTEDILYAYKLYGLDDEWTYSKKQRLVNYANLSPGEYTFRVKSTNSNGVWTDNERTLKIEVKPSFWQTKWAWALYCTLFTLTLFIILRSIFIYYRMKDKIRLEQEQTEMKTRFFTDISHEIRTPLTLIVSPIEDIIERDKVSIDAKPQLQLVLKNTNRMLSMVNQILDFRKIQKQKTQVREVQFGLLIENISHNFISTSKRKDIDLVINNQIGSEKIWVDTNNIETLIFNLISNAIKYTTTKGKKIEIKISKKDKAYVLQVKDEGIGMSKEIQSKIFTRFSSFNTDKSNPSTGIGLSIVKEIADKHHAKVTVESRINEGSIFTVYFRSGMTHFLDDADVEILDSYDDVEKDNLSQKSDITENSHKSELLSILIVEDDTDLRNFIKSVLSPYYKLYEACNGREGYEVAIKYTPDFILSDIMMPEMDGVEFIKKIRSNVDTSHIPFIFLTAKTSINDELEGVISGANDYITKPFNVKLLKAKIENILKQRKRFTDQFTESKTIENNESHITNYDEEFLKKVTDVIYSNIDNNELVIDDIVSETNLSRKVFYNKIKSLTGLAPVEFLREVRIKKAAQLILSKDYMIKEVAYMVGFTDHKYFSRCFKQICGVIPSEYKKHKKG